MRVGGTLLTGVGQLDIVSVDEMAVTRISEHNARRAADLSKLVGMEKLQFKTNVRKLEELGPTESLEIGYRLSPRGRLVFVMKGEA